MRLDEAKRDHYRKRAREEGYRSRAAFKIKQMNDKYHFMTWGSRVVDIGCAPGGWLQMSSQIVGKNGVIVGVDLDPVKPLSGNVKILQDDVASKDFAARITESLGNQKADCVLADLSPKLSGIWDMDHYRQIDLCMKVVDLLPEILKTNGSNVMKAFQGDQLDSLIHRLKKSFQRMEISKPEASRKESSEVYLVSIEFIGRVPSQHLEESQSQRQSEQPSDSIESDWQDVP
ncbi:MAG: RlmE family RNA methyltransferase [Nitrososphaerales archaeon]